MENIWRGRDSPGRPWATCLECNVTRNIHDRLSGISRVGANVPAFLLTPLRPEFLLQALKNFSLFENPDIQNVHLEEFLTRFISLVSGDLGQTRIKINHLVVPPVDTISADPRLLHQVILNLITNASDALNHCENAQIMIRAEKKEGVVALTIEDNGIGMSEEEQTNLFKPFYTTKPRGTGLGLMIALKMVTLMKGNMEIKSYKDTGTKVTVFIPEGIHNEHK